MCRICMCIVYAYWYVYMYRALVCMFLMRECACVRVLHVCVSTFCMCVLYVRRYAEVNNYPFFASAPGWGVCVHVHVYACVCVCARSLVLSVTVTVWLCIVCPAASSLVAPFILFH